MRRTVALVVVLAACASLPAAGSSAPSPAESLEASIVAAALAQKSVHWTESDVHCGAHWTSDVTADSGTQRVTTRTCWGGIGKAQIALVDHVAYVRGNRTGLQFLLYLPTARATRYAGRWLAIPKGNKFYAPLAAGLTLASIVNYVNSPADENPKAIRKTSRGTRLVVLTEGDPELAVLTLSARAYGDALPVGFSEWGDAGFSYKGRFSRWNEPVHVQAPASSTPIQTVCGRCSQPWPVG